MKTRDTLLQRIRDLFYTPEGNVNPEIMGDIRQFIDRPSLSPFKVRGPDGAQSALLPRTNYTMRVVVTREKPSIILTAGDVKVQAETEVQAYYMLAVAQRMVTPKTQKLKYDPEPLIWTMKNSSRAVSMTIEGKRSYRNPRIIDHHGMVLMMQDDHSSGLEDVTSVWVKSEPYQSVDGSDNLIKVGQEGVWHGHGLWIERYNQIIRELKSEVEFAAEERLVEAEQRKQDAEKKMLTDLSRAQTLLWSGSEKIPEPVSPPETGSRHFTKQQLSIKSSIRAKRERSK
jgi:hypothetical protein